MKPHSIGRVLGIGLRVAGRVAGQHVAGGAQAAASAPAANVSGRQPVDTVAQGLTTGRTAGQAARGVARGVGGFLQPFRRVGGIVWLEVTGVFFFLPVLVFAPTLWRVKGSYLRGPDHGTFLLTAGIMALFLYLGVSSFWRAWRR
jgi:hypothetical protein